MTFMDFYNKLQDMPASEALVQVLEFHEYAKENIHPDLKVTLDFLRGILVDRNVSAWLEIMKDGYDKANHKVGWDIIFDEFAGYQAKLRKT